MKRAAILTNRIQKWTLREMAIGGGERYTLDLANLLVEHGFSVDIYQPTLMYGQIINISENIRLICLRPEIEHGNPETWMCNEFYRRTPSYDMHIIAVPEYMAGKVHKDTLLTVQGCIWLNHSIAEMSDVQKRTSVSFFEKANKIISIHDFIVDDMREIGFDGDVRVIKHGIDTDVFTHNQNLKENLVLFPGRAEKSKGTDMYLELFRTKAYLSVFELKDPVLRWKYEWCGEGSEESYIPHRISAPQDKMHEVYDRASIVCVLNMTAKGNSLVLLEAMASGCACVAFSGHQDAITDGVNGLECEETVPSIHDKIMYLIEHEDERNSMGIEARKTIKNEYSKENWRENWISTLGL